MRAGPLRHLCILQRSERVPDGMGGGKDGWVEVRRIWAEITLPTGRSQVAAQQIQSVVTAEIRCRPADDIQALMRLVHKGTTYKIEAVLPDNVSSMLRLLCSSEPHP